MGVTGLWQILHPCARPIKLETLNRKRLAVDASIWIYQFLKAVRDKEGNALRNSHVVGFFRRICKLLFFGIKPVFVFDGGAPTLKRHTISARKKRREGRREDAVRTAGKLLAMQMQRRAEEEEQRRKDEQNRPAVQEEEVPDEGLVYADENMMTQQERQQSRKFRRKDAYHLPDLDVSMAEMGGPNDPRVMSLEELQAYAKQFETGEDINIYDFSKIDYDSPFFVSLPPSDRYNILNAARLRSRLRMGHSKEQLDSMFPDRMAFSKFQIERVTERNELTQRLMHLNEGGDTLFGEGRVAGEKGREYVLVKNDGVEGGWALGVISDEGTKQETAIDLDKPVPAVKTEEEDEDEEDFEDVPIEGLNRLPKRPKIDGETTDAYAKQRRAFYKSRKSTTRRRAKKPVDHNSLFVQEEAEDEDEAEWEEVDGNDELFGEGVGDGEEEDELQRAIAMSLQTGEENIPSEAEDNDILDIVNQSAVAEARPVPKGSGRAIANIVNRRAFNAAPESHEITSFGVPVPKPSPPPATSDNEDDMIDFQAALAESRRDKRKVNPPPRRMLNTAKPVSATEVAKQAGFSGPLPFEKLDLGSSLLGKKKMQERAEENAGGFENPEFEPKESRKGEPLPPWFSGSLQDDIEKQRALESEDRARAKEFSKQFQFQKRDEGGLMRRDTHEVIDLDADDGPGATNGEVVDLEAGYEEDQENDGLVTFDPLLRMGDIAEKLRAEPALSESKNVTASAPNDTAGRTPFVDADSDEEDLEGRLEGNDETEAYARQQVEDSPPLSGDLNATTLVSNRAKQTQLLAGGLADQQPVQMRQNSKQPAIQQRDWVDDDAEIEWSDSDNEQPRKREVKLHAEVPIQQASAAEEDAHAVAKITSRSPSVEFDDVGIPDHPQEQIQPNAANEAIIPASALVRQESLIEDPDEDEYGGFSDPEDEELMRALAIEAEEHARFASTLNNKSQAQNIADYEKELKQLRNQQKKDRRDADEVTQVMVQECQQLLRLFGLPYVTAPMEAEAQCAELVRLGLVDGIVTDDSDCFLFGGTRIYKNMFNQAKFVECYLTSDLEKEFDLTRDKLIAVAHLLGSDYTEGLPGVGPVTALEIISEFRTLSDFKDWLNGVQMNAITKADDVGNAFRKKFRRQAVKLIVPSNFPDPRVDVAYAEPEVDSDPEQFLWGVPDLDALRSFLMATIGWSQERTDEVLVPVIKDMNRRADEGTQSNITAFFDGGVGIGAAGATKGTARGEAFAPRKRVAESSKRMGTALSRMAEKARLGRGETADHTSSKQNSAQQPAEAAPEPKAAKGKRGRPSRQRTSAKTGDADDSNDDDTTGSEFEAPKKKRSRKQVRGITAGKS